MGGQQKGYSRVAFSEEGKDAGKGGVYSLYQLVIGSRLAPRRGKLVR